MFKPPSIPEFEEAARRAADKWHYGSERIPQSQPVDALTSATGTSVRKTADLEESEGDKDGT